jgi:CRP-like cAMP-binding protein
MNATEKLATLRRCEVLAAAEDDALERLAEAAELEHFGAGQIVFEAGEISSRIYVVAAGKLEARLHKDGPLISFFEPGALFGEYAMFVHGVRSAQVAAATECTLLSIDEQHFHDFLLRSPESALLLLGTAVRRLHRAERQRN